MAAADLTTATGVDLAMLLPDLLRDPDRILDQGPGQVDLALAHYLDELQLSMSSNGDILDSVEVAVRRLHETAPKVAQQVDLLASSSRKVFEANSDSARLLHHYLLELSLSEKALVAVNLADQCRAPIAADAVTAARQLVRSQAALSQLSEVVVDDDPELNRLRQAVRSNADVVVNDVVLGRTLFEFARFAKQTLTLDRRKAHLRDAFNASVAILNAPEADRVRRFGIAPLC